MSIDIATIALLSNGSISLSPFQQYGPMECIYAKYANCNRKFNLNYSRPLRAVERECKVAALPSARLGAILSNQALSARRVHLIMTFLFCRLAFTSAQMKLFVPFHRYLSFEGQYMAIDIGNSFGPIPKVRLLSPIAWPDKLCPGSLVPVTPMAESTAG